MAIVRADEQDLEQCVDIVFSSDLGKHYYPKRELLKAEMLKGFTHDSIYVKTSPVGINSGKKEVLGMVWYQMEGMFHSFPYLHMIAIKENYRSQGIGTELMDFFERDVLENGKNHILTKIFLTVADFNPNAETLYLRRGYSPICTIKGLFRRQVTETVMMKIVTFDKSEML